MNFRERLLKLKRDHAASIGSSSTTTTITDAAVTETTHHDDISCSSKTKRNKVEKPEIPKITSSISSSNSNSNTLTFIQSPHKLKKVNKIYLVCPPNVQTGGPEAMHQLCDKINSTVEYSNGDYDDFQVTAYMLYMQCHTGKGTGTRDNTTSYCRYCKYAKPIDAYSIYPHVQVCHDWNEVVSSSSSLVIWPECWTEFMNVLNMNKSMNGDRGTTKGGQGGGDGNHHQQQQQQQHKQAIWWLSVDNNRGKFQEWHRRRDILHLYQSEYARQYIMKHLNHDNNDMTATTQSLVFPMTEYIPFRHRQPHPQPQPECRDLEILYNPLKGLHYTDEIRKRSGKKFQFTPISSSSNSSSTSEQGNYNNKRLSPTEVVQLLRRGKVYIDFGNHPGMDRLPREAAMAGCIVITNKEGAAYYDKDVPIPNQYKFETFHVERIHDLLRDCIVNYEKRVHDFDAYREWIGQQESQMESCVKELLTKLVLD
eukprot:CAMPEP_0176489220 /NCGR_PEP_ID=MMETSP0200_2-20121128/7161_1 /TAXON_ID=947934 /ORGANISM="Chaetoceros sp., Strain GSL56" /LENGTH=479 /DNA_ID=CAMNT_0017886325 /DNA_START=357 /DNA_END=1793 /DNA_ORIENTATION=-